MQRHYERHQLELKGGWQKMPKQHSAARVCAVCILRVSLQGISLTDDACWQEQHTWCSKGECAYFKH